MNILVQNRADVNIRSLEGFTPLMFATNMGQKQCVEMLLKAGADMNSHVNGLTALHFAAQHCTTSHQECIKIMLVAGINVNDFFWFHRETPLILALKHGAMESVNMLLEGGANVNQEKPGDEMALVCAVKYGYLKLTEILILQAGADVNQKDKHGNPVMHLID